MYGFESNELVDLIGSKVKIVSKDLTPLEGYLHTVDPISHHVVLFQPDQDKVMVVFHHDIQQLTIHPQERLDIDQHLPSTHLSTQTRRQQLIALLKQHRVPIEYNEDDPVIYVLGCARVESPYVATSVVCDNALIRQRVRNMILEL
ncbi:hypothetical protein EDC96DRAFT_579066 [Choanephora cucurbitarum]|nr:hypothetical protein EDC96DRAFT_579066 [Choanephora cucurbitarum]